MHPYVAMVNSELDAQVNVLDRGLQYGHGLFETVRVSAGTLPLLPWHLSRLSRDCRRLNIRPPDLQDLKQDIRDLLVEGAKRWQIRGPLNARLKILVTAGQGGRGYQPEPAAIPTVILQLFPRQFQQPTSISACVCKARLGASVLHGIKHCNRLEQVVLAQEVATAGCFEGIVCDQQGAVVEGVASNVVLMQGDKLVTPALRNCGVAGVMRAYMIEQGWLQVAAEPLRVSDLLAAEQLYFVNSNWGALRVDALTVAGDTRCYEPTVAGLAFTQQVNTVFTEQAANGDSKQ